MNARAGMLLACEALAALASVDAAAAQTFGAIHVEALDPRAGVSSTVTCTTPLHGNACLVFTCAECANQPITMRGQRFTQTISEEQLTGLGYGQCTVEALDVGVDLSLSTRFTSNTYLLMTGPDVFLKVLAVDSCGSKSVHAIFDDDAPGAAGTCPAIGTIKPAHPFSDYLPSDLARPWVLLVDLPQPKTVGTLEGWAFAADVQCKNTPGTCAPTTTTTCLNKNRFRVSMTYRTTAKATGPAHANQLTGDTGWFWFFAPQNVEVVLKVLDGCGVNGRYWVYSSGLTDVAVTITVFDTQTSRAKTYTNPLGQSFKPIFDIDAFPCS